MRSFALGELGWTLDRYLKASFYEFAEASKGYWRNRERTWRWMTRELLWELMSGNPYYKPEDKPKRKDEIFKLSTDEVEKKKKVKPEKYTQEDLDMFQRLQFNKQ